ncbi:MAG TPA: serine hydrolase domain-containing protein [Burkholderiaceae bacterium]|nr:serine hydrolase domain-containing protein [Burkholderiaceae bacterium]
MTLPRNSLIFFVVTLAAFQAQAGALAPDVATKVDEVFKKWDKSDSPGCAVGIYKDGKIAYQRGYGMADLNNDVPNTPATVFHVASMSKQFTAMSIMLLVQQGKLSLDDDVHRYIPELPDFGQKITIAHLLHHTSGMRDQWDLLELAGWRYSQDLITDDDVMSVIEKQKELNFTPGDKFVYSNTGFTLLGLVVKRISGMSLREFTTKNIFEPLGMTHTHFRDDHAEIIKHDAVGYALDNEKKTFRISITNFDTVGATSLHTTVEDLLLWDENFYHPRVGDAAILKQMQERGKLNNGEQIDYALGLDIGSYRGLPTVDHGGADAGYRSDMTRFPEQHFTAAVLCNSSDANPSVLARKIADIVLAKDFKLSETSGTKQSPQGTGTGLSLAEMTAFAGTYWNREQDDFEKIIAKDGKLNIDFGNGDIHLLKSFGNAHFHVADTPWGDNFDLHFVASTSTTARHMGQSFGENKPDVYEPVGAPDLHGVVVGDYVGGYASDEIDPIYRIAVDDGKLILTRLKHKADTLWLATRDVYVGDIGTVRFTRDVNSHIVGFTLNAGRVRNSHFKRLLN